MLGSVLVPGCVVHVGIHDGGAALGASHLALDGHVDLPAGGVLELAGVLREVGVILRDSASDHADDRITVPLVAADGCALVEGVVASQRGDA